MRKSIKIALGMSVALFCVALTFAQVTNLSKEGYVPNKETAIKVAEALWLPAYGDKINNSKPFVAKLKDGKVWIVQGTLHAQKGGVPYIEIQKTDCKVLKMYHGK
jgi:hypothetical protein